ncbi:MAG: T9SS type A sorting domain-containing protein [Bacteroidota bacterium]
MKTKICFTLLIALSSLVANAQCHFIRSDSQNTDTVSYLFSGGAFASLGCAAIDPTYWLAGNGNTVTVTFVNPQSYPEFMVWGMNGDDIASVSVNGTAYPLTASSASYDTKVVCGLSPGPDGIIFNGGNLTGADTSGQGNYSYQNVQLNIPNVNTITVTGIAGAGWGFGGVYVGCPTQSGEGISDVGVTLNNMHIFPNPIESATTIQFTSIVKNASLEFVNVLGEKVKTINHVSGNEIQIQRENLSAGIYFVQLIQNNQIVGNAKFVIAE